MDPALQEMMLGPGSSDDEVSVIVRLRDSGKPPPGVRIVTRFGDIATARIPRSTIADVWADDNTVSLKAPRTYQPDIESLDSDSEPEAPNDERRTDGLAATGRGVVIGVVDWGCDFAHPDLRHPDGRTRLLGLWDQRPGYGPGVAPYGYGRIFDAEQIDAALRNTDPYGALGYDPADFDSGLGAHGTHTLSIACGNGRLGGPAGVAPESDCVFVNMGASRSSGTPLGSSAELLDGLHYIDEVAGERPCVINFSLGRHAGEHTGHSLVEMAMDTFLSSKPGRAIVQSCGNYYERRIHDSWQLHPGGVQSFNVHVDPDDRTPNEIDIWYPGRDRLTVGLASGDRTLHTHVELGETTALTDSGRDIARIYHRSRDPNNGDNQCNIVLEPTTDVHAWEITLIADDVVDGRVHAWIERDSACRTCQSRFPDSDADPRTTLGSIATGFRTIVVGAYDGHRPDHPIARFSSSGPTRDGRRKPDLLAPGVMILGARSRGTDPRQPYTRMSGTSMAAPAVAGTVALMFEQADRPISIDETRRALLASCNTPETGSDNSRFGNGYLNTEKAVIALAEAGIVSPKPDQLAPTGAIISTPESASDPVPEENPAPHRCADHAEPSAEPIAPGTPGTTEFVGASACEDSTRICGDPLARPDRVLARVEARLRGAGRSGDKWLEEILRCWGLTPPSPVCAADVFDAFTTAVSVDGLTELFTVIAAPTSKLTVPIHSGDLMITRGRGSPYANIAVVAQPDMHPLHTLAAAGYTTDSAAPGLYIHVLNPQHRSTHRYAQRVADADATVPGHLLVLRPHLSEHTPAPGPWGVAADRSPEQADGDRPLLRQGSRGDAVSRAQQLLNQFLAAITARPTECVDQSPQRVAETLTSLRRNGQLPLVVDGRFGPSTKHATKLFQSCLGLVRDGVVGPVTWHHLQRNGSPQAPDPPMCGVPDHPTADLEHELDLEREELDEESRKATPVSARLSLFQNASITKHRNHFENQATRAALMLGAFADPRTDRCLPRRVGPTQYNTGADIISAITAAHACLGQRLTAVHIFGHSGPAGTYGSPSSDGLFSAARPASHATGARAIADIPTAPLANDVVVVLHGCNQGSGSDSFAELLYRHLAARLAAPTVFAHPDPGCAGRDNSWRRFDATTPGGRAVKTIAPHYSGDGRCSARKRSRAASSIH